jgi:hypothetical protein
MVYIDENGAEIESFDLKKGYLVDEEWIDHPAIPEVGHYEYEPLTNGGRRQKYVVDEEGIPAWREVTKQKYVLYQQEEQTETDDDYAAQIAAQDAKIQELIERELEYEMAYQEGVQMA